MRAALADSRLCTALPLVGILCGVCALCAACAEPARGALAGASDAWTNAPEPSAALPPPPPPAVWAMYGAALRWAPVSSAPFRSRGHEPHQEVDVRANDIARDSYVTLVTDTLFPDGSLLVELPHKPDSASSGYAMHKSSGEWSYLQLDSRGGVAASGALWLCLGCHAQAPADNVFGLPRQPMPIP